MWSLTLMEDASSRWTRGKHFTYIPDQGCSKSRCSCHPSPWSGLLLQRIAEALTITASIVNGGDGSSYHPSQSLLDLMTTYQEFVSHLMLAWSFVRRSGSSRKTQAIWNVWEPHFAGPDEWKGNLATIRSSSMKSLQLYGCDDVLGAKTRTSWLRNHLL